MAYSTAETLKELCLKRDLPLIFKGSFDKANRTSFTGARGAGMEAGLEILSEIRTQLQLPVLTDIHTAEQAKLVSESVDIIQIPAFLCRQTDIITAAAETGRVLNIKKGQFLSPQEMLPVAEKAKSAGAKQVLLTERGASFGYNNLVSDMRSLVIMRDSGCPVIYDATHSVQLPGGRGDSSGGERAMIPPLLRAAVAVGINGLFIETHPAPEKAISDRETQWELSQMGLLLDSALALDMTRREFV